MNFKNDKKVRNRWKKNINSSNQNSIRNINRECFLHESHTITRRSSLISNLLCKRWWNTVQKSYCKVSSKINHFDSFKNMRTSQNEQEILKKRRLCFIWNFCNNFWKTICRKYNCDIDTSILHTYATLLKTMSWNFIFFLMNQYMSVHMISTSKKTITLFASPRSIADIN